MLVFASGSCERCGDDFQGETLQSVSVTCKKCGRSYNLCSSCKSRGCPKCRGKLLDQWEFNKEKGIDILF